MEEGPARMNGLELLGDASEEINGSHFGGNNITLR